MSENTTDLDEQILLALAKPYLHERAEAVEQLISNREKLLLDRVEKEVGLLTPHSPIQYEDTVGIVDVLNTIDTLRKELDGGSDE